MIDKFKKNKVKNVTFTLNNMTVDKLQRLSSVTGLSKSAIVRNLVEMFGDVYLNVVKLVDEYDGDASGLTLDDYLRKNGYDFLVTKKECK